MTSDWLPSERVWLEDIALRLLDGELLLLRALPRWGVSSLCNSLVQQLGTEALLVRGRSFTESDQAAQRERLNQSLTTTLSRNHQAQLVFDDYWHAIRRSQGGALHSMLYRALVDSDEARDTGALLVARTGDVLDLPFAGSPLLSRTRTVSLPRLSDEDAAILNRPLADLVRLVGESTWLARRFLGNTDGAARMDAVDHLRHDADRIVEALPPAALEVIAGARDLDSADALSREALALLGCCSSDGYRLAELVQEAALQDEVTLRSPGWPSSWCASVDRFVELLHGVSDALWVDRYAMSDPSRLGAFLNDVRKETDAQIRILCSRDPEGDHDEDVRLALQGLPKVQVRFMTRYDYRRLHDRHLVFTSRNCGFVLPTAGVVLAKDDPGSAVSVPMPTLALDFDECWQRASPVFPLTT